MKNKVIHCCWFGRNPKSKLIQKCIESWKKYCPDYEIKEWNEDNFDINCCAYVREAYEAKKWAFVSDYCRFYILYNYGGIYLDTDVELLKTLDGLGQNFVGFEDSKRVNSGLVRGASKGDHICELMLQSYHKDRFLKKDGSFNLMTVCDRETQILQKFGMKLNNQMQVVCETTIYPTEYFQPIDMSTGIVHKTKNTVSIHHYTASWESGYNRLRGRIYKTVNRLFGKKAAENLRKICGREKINK